MVSIATLSVSIGISVMLIALGVIYGFKKEISAALGGFGAHVTITALEGNNSLETPPITTDVNYPSKISQLDNVKNIHKFARKAGIVKNDDVMEGIMLKGLGQDFDWSFYEQMLIRGSLPRVSDSMRTRDVLISEVMAKRLNLDTASKVEMIFIQNPPRRDLYKVSGIYRSNFEEMDKILMITDIRNLQRLNNWSSNQVSGYEINGYDLRNLTDLHNSICDVMSEDPQIQESLIVSNLRQKNQMIFDWLATHDLNALVIIIVMLVVAIFNMASALLIILLEKSRFIGVMKTLGADNRLLQKVFLWRAVYIVTKGIIWGNLCGIAICLIQKYSGIIKLDSAGYFLNQVPISFNWATIILLNIGVFAVIVICQLIPTHIVSKISPEKTVRYE
jgi:lipoprotein-releasing system permease protein